MESSSRITSYNETDLDYSAVLQPVSGEFNTDLKDECFYHDVATCPECGAGMIRQGTCTSCPLCGFGSCGG
ncbi:MAG TPA: hypothetical protein PLF13_07900 [candidate division Zixibacteria bacterium]|nr:hypothetical protein [candidate division Zixibacteria bacterium]